MLSQKIPWYYSFPVIILSTLLAVILIYAWQEPTAPPPGGNVPAPINVGASTQYKAGALGIGGILQSFGPFVLPCLNTTQRNALSPTSGMMIYNVDTNEIQVYATSNWGAITGAPAKLGLGEPCSSNGDCDSGSCVDGVCCNDTCTGDCEVCNLPGNEGTCTVRSADDNTECPPCYRCDGVSTRSIVAPDGDEGNKCTGDCTHCVSGNCVNWPDYEQHEGCTALCKSCISGFCQYNPNGTDPNNECGGSSCCGYCNGSGACAYVANGSTCSSPGNACTATHYRCNGGGSCTAPTDNYIDAGICVGRSNDTDTCNSLCVAHGYDGGQAWYSATVCPPPWGLCSTCCNAYDKVGWTCHDFLVNYCDSYSGGADDYCFCKCWEWIYDSPHLYSYNGSSYDLISDFLALSKENEKTYFVEIPEEKIKETDGKYKIKIRGEKDEITYLDKIYLKLTDTKGNEEVVTILEPTYISKDNLSLITESDDNYLILNKGDEVFLEFDAPDLKDGYQRKIEFAAEGYYRK